MNAIVFGRDKGKRSERFPLTRKMCALPEAISVGGGSQSSSDINIKEIAFIFIVYNGSWRYHLIIIDSIAEAVSE